MWSDRQMYTREHTPYTNHPLITYVSIPHLHSTRTYVSSPTSPDAHVHPRTPPSAPPSPQHTNIHFPRRSPPNNDHRSYPHAIRPTRSFSASLAPARDDDRSGGAHVTGRLTGTVRDAVRLFDVYVCTYSSGSALLSGAEEESPGMEVGR